MKKALQKPGLTSYQLKWIAIIAMVIDHIGAVLYPGELPLRVIGRLSFPIFCFLLTEGFCHTHDRRMEVYLYFEMPEDAFVMHYMGEPDETRHLVIRNEQAVISPSWSIHSGSGSRNYTFIWGMVGENQDFDDMDGVANRDLM